ncbi:TIGR02587 family membrane protein [Novipirellula sp. SH528]|uniref:TIGR02587 family membrane protein n=1 Tax=Novipirellula sp. SH528 TaxID=3454466 RepID=UPI003FA07634
MARLKLGSHVKRHDRPSVPRIFPRRFAVGLSRAAGGALLFSLPMLMTMEMWWMGFTMRPLQIASLLAALFPILVGLAFYSGFEEPVGILGAIVDAFVAYCVGCVIAATILIVLAVLRPFNETLYEIVGKIILHAMAASFGAVLASSQMSDDDGQQEQQGRQRQSTKHAHNNLGCYFREMFLMLAGAIFLALNVAPTEEVILVAFKMTAWHGLVLVGLSLVIMHAFVYKLKFHGQVSIPEEHSATSVFFRFTIPGYAIALLVSLFCLWVFGRTEYTAFDEVVMSTTVLAMPAAVGAAAARLIL